MAVNGTAAFTPGTETPNFSDTNLAGTFAGPASYTTGGETQDFAADHGLNTAPNIRYGYARAVGSAHYAVYDTATSKWIFYVAGTGVEVAATTDLSASTFHYHALRAA